MTTNATKNEKLDEILSKLRKLQKLYEGAKAINSEEEANAAAAKIQHLLTLYNLSMEEIRVEEKKTAPIVQENVSGYTYRSIGGRWEFRLYAVLCRYNFCRCFVYGRSYKKILLVGEEHNKETVKWLKDVLSRKYVELSNEYWKDYRASSNYVMRPVSKDRYQRSFLLGCCTGLSTKLQQEAERDKNDVEIGGKINALMVRKGAELDQWLREQFGGIRTVRTTDPHMSQAFNSGYAEGRNTNIARPISGTRAAADNLKMLGA